MRIRDGSAGIQQITQGFCYDEVERRWQGRDLARKGLRKRPRSISCYEARMVEKERVTLAYS